LTVLPMRVSRGGSEETREWQGHAGWRGFIGRTRPSPQVVSEASGARHRCGGARHYVPEIAAARVVVHVHCASMRVRTPSDIYISGTVAGDLRQALLGDPQVHPSAPPPPVTSDMSVPVSDIRKRLEKLDPKNANYQQLLLELCSHQGLRPYIQGLQEVDLKGFVELLDKVSRVDNDMLRG
jgi:hypothetical protein